MSNTVFLSASLTWVSVIPFIMPLEFLTHGRCKRFNALPCWICFWSSTDRQIILFAVCDILLSICTAGILTCIPNTHSHVHAHTHTYLYLGFNNKQWRKHADRKKKPNLWKQNILFLLGDFGFLKLLRSLWNLLRHLAIVWCFPSRVSWWWVIARSNVSRRQLPKDTLGQYHEDHKVGHLKPSPRRANTYN